MKNKNKMGSKNSKEVSVKVEKEVRCPSLLELNPLHKLYRRYSLDWYDICFISATILNKLYENNLAYLEILKKYDKYNTYTTYINTKIIDKIPYDRNDISIFFYFSPNADFLDHIMIGMKKRIISDYNTDTKSSYTKEQLERTLYVSRLSLDILDTTDIDYKHQIALGYAYTSKDSLGTDLSQPHKFLIYYHGSDNNLYKNLMAILEKRYSETYQS